MAEYQDLKRSTTVWQGGARFAHTVGRAAYVTDANLSASPDFVPAGPSPMEMLLGALAGCTGVDLVMILERMRLKLTDLRIEVAAERGAEHPRVYQAIHLEIHVATEPVDCAKVRRALSLSADKYCSVSAMLAGSARITYALHCGGEQIQGVFHEEQR